MTRRTLLLISPPVLHAARWSWWASGIASKPHLASLAGYVRDLADVRFLQLDLGETAAAIDSIEDHLTPDVALVGVSCWASLHYLGAVAVIRRIRELAPTLPIVVGGHHPSAVPEDFLEGELADWIVRGDGEHVLRDLCETWPARPSAPTVIVGRPFELPPGDHLDWEGYAEQCRGQRSVWMAMSRGCPFRCNFCMEPQHNPTWHALSTKAALNQLERLATDVGPEVVCFADPLFGANRRWTEALLAGIEERELGMMFWAETRADLMTPDLLERLLRCRFKVDFGLDTGSQEMVRKMVKSPAPQSYLRRSQEMLLHANAIGLHHDIYLLFNYPGETPETVRETRRFVEEIGRRAKPRSSGWISGQTFFIVPGTAVYAERAALSEQLGTQIRNPTWWRTAGDQYTLATDVIPSREWQGRERELRWFHQWQAKLNFDWARRYPSEVRDFRMAFHGTRPLN